MSAIDDAITMATQYEDQADPLESAAGECGSAADEIIAAYEHIGDGERPQIVEQAAKPGLDKVRQGVALIREGFQDFRNGLEQARSGG